MVKALIMPFSGPDPKAQFLLGFALYRPEARNWGVILGRKVKKPDIRLCHARPKNLRSLGCKSVQVQAAAGLFGDFNHYPVI